MAMKAAEPVVWVKSSYSNATGNCVEVGQTPGQVLVRDTKDHGQGVLAVAPEVWVNFLAEVR